MDNSLASNNSDNRVEPCSCDEALDRAEEDSIFPQIHKLDPRGKERGRRRPNPASKVRDLSPLDSSRCLSRRITAD